MTGYEQGDALIFTSGGQIRRGWNETLQRYRKTYPDTRSMGTLKFSDLEIRLVGSSAAVVLGRWELTRENDHPHGVFTLVLKKGAEGWKIIHDHTSSAP
jgi:ketosteroid isomerase-like protein